MYIQWLFSESLIKQVFWVLRYFTNKQEHTQTKAKDYKKYEPVGCRKWIYSRVLFQLWYYKLISLSFFPNKTNIFNVYCTIKIFTQAEFTWNVLIFQKCASSQNEHDSQKWLMMEKEGEVRMRNKQMTLLQSLLSATYLFSVVWHSSLKTLSQFDPY